MISRLGSVQNYAYTGKPLAFRGRYDKDLTPEQERKNKNIDRGVSIGMASIPILAVLGLLAVTQCNKNNGEDIVAQDAQVRKAVEQILNGDGSPYNCEKGALEIKDLDGNIIKHVSTEAVIEEMKRQGGGDADGLGIIKGICDKEKK